MTSHGPHPDSHTHGLADGCPRCREHAEHPERSLDRENLRRLLRGETYTETDRVAEARLKEQLRVGRFLEAVLAEEPPAASEAPLPVCGECGERVSDPASDGAVGFIRVGLSWYHIPHAPQPYPPGVRPEPDEDIDAWHEAEGAAAEAEADRLTSDPDYMGRGR